MKVYHYLFLLFMLVSCSDSSKDEEIVPDNDYLTIDISQLTFDTESGSQQIEFNASKNWTASLSAGTDSWCNISPTHGTAGKGSIQVTVTPNETYDERNTAIQIVSGKIKKAVTITQKQQDALILESNKVEVACSGGAVTIHVKTNTSFTYEIDKKATWIHKDNKSSRGLSNQSITLKIDKNDATSVREGSLLIKGANKEEKVTIYQAGDKPQTVISQTEYIVSSKGETLKVEVKSNSSYKYTLPKVDWIQENKSRALSAFTHYFTVSPNPTYDTRKAVILFTNTESGKTEEVTIEQLQKDALLLSKSAYYISKADTTLQLKISTNVTFKVSTDSKWIHVEEPSNTRGLVDKYLNIKIDANTTQELRIGFITLSASTGTQKIKISQDNYVEKMDIEFIHYQPIFVLPEFIGTDIQGTISWGDGTHSDLSKEDYHSFGHIDLRTTTIKAKGIKGFKVKTIGTISAIIIYTDKKQEGSTEDLDNDYVEWD